jgi:hypothetical protein
LEDSYGGATTLNKEEEKELYQAVLDLKDKQ